MLRQRTAFPAAQQRARESLDRVVKAYDSVWMAPRKEQFQRNCTATSLDERNSFPDEDGDNVDNELIDFLLIQKRRDDPAAAHHPNIFARLRAQSLRESPDRLADELDSRLQ